MARKARRIRDEEVAPGQTIHVGLALMDAWQRDVHDHYRRPVAVIDTGLRHAPNALAWVGPPAISAPHAGTGLRGRGTAPAASGIVRPAWVHGTRTAPDASAVFCLPAHSSAERPVTRRTW